MLDLADEGYAGDGFCTCSWRLSDMLGYLEIKTRNKRCFDGVLIKSPNENLVPCMRFNDFVDRFKQKEASRFNSRGRQDVEYDDDEQKLGRFLLCIAVDTLLFFWCPVACCGSCLM